MDRTTNGHPGTYHGSPVLQERGVINSDANTAITLDGRRSYIEIANHPSRTSPDRPNRLSAYLFNPEGGLGAGAYVQEVVRAGAWMQVVACFAPGDATTPGAGVRLYKNGILRQGPPAPGTLYCNLHWQITSVHGNAPLRLGTRDLQSFLTGGLDEVAIYPLVLTAKEILDQYHAGIGA